MSADVKMTELVEDVDGDAFGSGFRVRYRYQDHWCDVEAWKTLSIGLEGEDKGRKYFEAKGSITPLADPTTDVDKAEKYLDGYIKWDGCSELTLGHHHWCGPYYFKTHFAVLKHIYKRAQSLMKSGDEEPWLDD